MWTTIPAFGIFWSFQFSSTIFTLNVLFLTFFNIFIVLIIVLYDLSLPWGILNNNNTIICSVWCRKTVQLPEQSPGRPLHLHWKTPLVNRLFNVPSPELQSPLLQIFSLGFSNWVVPCGRLAFKISSLLFPFELWQLLIYIFKMYTCKDLLLNFKLSLMSMTFLSKDFKFLLSCLSLSP